MIARGMAKAPGDRYASAGELVAEARAAFGDRPAAAETTVRPSAPPPPAFRRDHPGGRADASRARRNRSAPPGRPPPCAGLPRPLPRRWRPARHRLGRRPLPRLPPRPRPRRQKRPGGAGSRAPRSRCLVVLGLAGAAAGYVLGSGGDDSGTASDPLANSASAGTVGLSFPAGWRRVSEEPGIPGARFDQPVVLAPASGRARLVAGQVAATGPALLPAGLLARLPGGAPDGEPVHLGRLEALRYRNLKPRGLDGSLQLYAVPTTRGVATVACTTPAGPEAASFLANCESVATSLQLSGAKPYALGPDPAYARTLSTTLGKLDRARAPAAARLRRADTPGRPGGRRRMRSSASTSPPPVRSPGRA